MNVLNLCEDIWLKAMKWSLTDRKSVGSGPAMAKCDEAASNAPITPEGAEEHRQQSQKMINELTRPRKRATILIRRLLNSMQRCGILAYQAESDPEPWGGPAAAWGLFTTNRNGRDYFESKQKARNIDATAQRDGKHLSCLRLLILIFWMYFKEQVWQIAISLWWWQDYQLQ